MIIKNDLLIINGGSSSIKFAIYRAQGILIQILSGSINNIGSTNSQFHFINSISKEEKSIGIEVTDFEAAATYLIDWLVKLNSFISVKAIGHRIVHGMQHKVAKKVTAKLLAELKQIIPYSPKHLPGEIKLIEMFSRSYPKIVQVACFDTSFHSQMPTLSKLLPIPRKYFAKGIQRYGFHGLSYQYLLQELKRIDGHEVAMGNIIMAHLGNGASIAAIKKGKCIDTSMGFTPSSGLVMGTRTGDLDPGVTWYFMQVEKFTPQQFNDLINEQSGLLGISGKTSDMRELIKRKKPGNRAADAFNLFCYQAKKYIGAYSAALEGLDTLVFSGGIGEHSPEVRNQVCKGLEFLGIVLDEIKNGNNEAVISTKNSKVSVRVMKTNEELMIANMVCKIMGHPIKN